MKILIIRHSKSRFFLRGQNLICQILRKKKWKNITKNHLICVKNEEKTVKTRLKLKNLVYACKSQDFAQSQKIFARSHDRETVTFRNSASSILVLYNLFYNVLYT